MLSRAPHLRARLEKGAALLSASDSYGPENAKSYITALRCCTGKTHS